MDELNKFKENPLSAIDIAVGDPAPNLVPQHPSEGVVLDAVYSDEVTRFIMKKARWSRDDIRIFDTEGELAFVSHYPGKNPYESVDPFGITDTFYSPLGTWESVVDVTSYSSSFEDYVVRPKTLTIHGRQLLKRYDETFLNVAKLGKLKTLSIRDKFGVFLGSEKDMLFEVSADLFGRTFSFRNTDGELVAVMTKTTKALIKTALLGRGSEFTIDIAPGMDISIVLASVFGVMQVGNSLIKDASKNFLFDPLQDQFQDEAFNIIMGGDEESELIGFLGDQTEDGGLLEVFGDGEGGVDLGDGLGEAFGGDDGGLFDFGDGGEGMFDGVEDLDFGDAVDGFDGEGCLECLACLCEVAGGGE